MKPLGKNEIEDGEINNVVTDLDFVPTLIDEVGFCLSTTTPAWLSLLHEHEREIRQKAEEEIAAIEEMERNRPWKDKLTIAMAIARNGEKLY